MNGASHTSEQSAKWASKTGLTYKVMLTSPFRCDLDIGGAILAQEVVQCPIVD
jgi:hypothetical protein